MSSNCITYHINMENQIVFVSDEWQFFADNNNAANLTAAAVLNRSLNEFVTDTKVQHLYETLIECSRNMQKELKFSFRCDSPDRRRFMLMRIIPLGDGLIGFKSCIEREEAREQIPLLAENADRSLEYLIICSWCKKIKYQEKYWLEVEEAIERMGLFGQELLPELSHGICPICYESTIKEFKVLVNRQEI